MSDPRLVVMAAGMGSRYGGLKQLEPVGPSGEIILDYSVYDALNAGFGPVVFVIKEEMEEAFRERVGKTIGKRCEITYVFQRLDDVPEGYTVPPVRSKPWGTAHAAFSARFVIDGPFAVINADDFYGRGSYRALVGYLRGAQDRDGTYDYCMVGFVLRNTLTDHGHVARGVCRVDEDGFLEGIREHTRIEKLGESARYTEDGKAWVEISGDSVVSMNMWGFTPSLFSQLESRFFHFTQTHRGDIDRAEYFLPNVVGAMIQEGVARVRVLPTNERWFGVTYRQDKPQVKEAIRDLIRLGVYPERLWA